MPMVVAEVAVSFAGRAQRRVTRTGWSFASSLQTTVKSVQSIPQTSDCNNSQEDEKCHKLFTHKRDEKGEEGEEESLRGRDT